MNKRLAALTAEFIGTFALIFVGAGSIVANKFSGGGLGVTGIALAHGLILSLMIVAVGGFSGGVFNPAIQIGLWIAKRMDTATSVLYIIAQLLGAAVAGWLLAALVPADAAAATALGGTLVADKVTPVAAMGLELIMTFFLTTAALGAANHAFAGFGVGLVVAADILLGGAFTGAAMNPARTFGPAVATGNFANHWVYWVGPVLGAVLAVLVKDYLLGARSQSAGNKAA